MAVLELPVQWSRWWATKTGVERGLTIAVAALVIAALAWIGVWQPLTRDLAALRAAQPLETAALVAARTTVAEIAGLARGAPALPTTDPRAAAERVLAAAGLRGLVTQIDVTDSRMHLVFNTVPFDQLMPALETLQRDARLRLIDGTLTARVETGMVRAELTLGR
jgi:type II secretory pathway component PulM